MFHNKLYARTDSIWWQARCGNILGRHQYTTKEAKFVNLFDINIMLVLFHGGQHVTCDSAYMGNIMAQIACNIWKINMVGKIRSNQLVRQWLNISKITL